MRKSYRTSACFNVVCSLSQHEGGPASGIATAIERDGTKAQAPRETERGVRYGGLQDTRQKESTKTLNAVPQEQG